MDFGAALRQHDKPQTEAVEESKTNVMVNMKSDTAPTTRDPLDPGPLVVLFDKFHEKIDTMEVEAGAHQVTDDESCDAAVEMSSQAKKLFQRVEKKRQELKEPYLKVTRVLDGKTKPLKDRLRAIQKQLESKTIPYVREKDIKRREAEQKAREEAARIQAQMDAQAAETGESAPVVVAEILPETQVQTESGTAKLKTDLDFEIIDFRKLPEACFEMRKEEIKKAVTPWIRAQIKAGLRNIEGVRVFEKATLDTRVRR